MSNNQSFLDNGQMRDVRVVLFDADGNMSDKKIAVGQAATYAEAVKMAKDAGYTIAPEGEGYDIGHIANADGPDAYGIPAIAQ